MGTTSQSPGWLALLAPIPADVVPQHKPVASADQIAEGSAGAVAGWHNVTIHLSDRRSGSRNVLITLDESGRILSAGDHVMFIRDATHDGIVLVSEHESVGGRFEVDGSFNGTRWHTRMERAPDPDDEYAQRASTPSPPTDDDIAALSRLVADLMSRKFAR